MKTKLRRRIVWILLSITGLILIGAIIIGSLTYQRLKIFTNEKAVALLEEKFDNVQLEGIDFGSFLSDRWIPGFDVEGKGLSLGLKNRSDAPPFISIERFTTEVTFQGLFESPISFHKITLEGLEIQIPPKNRTPEQERKKSEGPDKSEKKFPDLYFERIIADGTLLRIISGKPDRKPLEFVLHELAIEGLGPDNPMHFDAVLDNAKPPGRIDTVGTFGPLRLDDPGSSAVSGRYNFREADLSVFGGIAGILSSEGQFKGTLGRLEVNGSSRVPDFRLKQVEYPVPLQTEFFTIVDGTNGDTILQPVKAKLGRSEFEVRGTIARRPEEKAKTVTLLAVADKTPIEDMIRLAVQSEQPVLTGDVTFDSQIIIPPGKQKVIEKLILDGEFEVASARFPDPGIQEKVNSLSRAGKGNQDDESESQNSHVVANLKGKYLLKDALMDFERISFAVPGAEVVLTGAYNLAAKELGFRGELLLDAKISQTQTGIKSFFLKIVDPLFSRDGVGAVIPIKISGPLDDVSFGVEKGRIFSRKSVATSN